MSKRSTSSARLAAAVAVSVSMTMPGLADNARNAIDYGGAIGNLRSDAGAAGYREAMRDHPMYANAVGDLQGTTVFGAEGATLGTVSGVGCDDDGRVYALVQSGGFFGLGGREVALPLDRMTLIDTDIAMDALTETGFETLPHYAGGSLSVADIDARISDIVTDG